MTFIEYCNNYCPYRHNEHKRHMEPCINCPLMTWLDMVERQMWEHPRGEWVKFTELKELNRELVEAINDLLWHVDGYDQFKDPIYNLLAKIEEGEGE